MAQANCAERFRNFIDGARLHDRALQRQQAVVH
jgi:hypothetical protein